MSLTTMPKRIVFNTFTADTVQVNSGIVSIIGLPDFAAASVEAGSCYRSCPVACTKQIVTVTPTVPSSTCECPWAWSITIEGAPCLKTYRTHEVFPRLAIYDYVDPNGATPTVDQIITSIVAQINSDPNSVVTAAAVGSTPNQTAFTLTEKDCDSDNASCGFNAFVQSGTVATTGGSNVAHVDAVLPASQVAREWPILPGHIFNRPEIAYCGTYCVYRFRINPVAVSKDPHLSNAEVGRFLDVEIWANSAATGFNANFDDEIVAAITCLGEPLSGSGTGTGTGTGT